MILDQGWKWKKGDGWSVGSEFQGGTEFHFAVRELLLLLKRILKL